MPTSGSSLSGFDIYTSESVSMYKMRSPTTIKALQSFSLAKAVVNAANYNVTTWCGVQKISFCSVSYFHDIIVQKKYLIDFLSLMITKQKNLLALAGGNSLSCLISGQIYPRNYSGIVLIHISCQG